MIMMMMWRRRSLTYPSISRPVSRVDAVVPRRVPYALPVRHQDGEVCDDKVIVVMMMMMIMVMVLMMVMMVTMVVVVMTTIIIVITMITMTMMMMDSYVDK